MKNVPYLVVVAIATLGLAWTLQVRTTDNRVIASSDWLPVSPDAGLTNIAVTRDICLQVESVPQGQCAVWTNGTVAAVAIQLVANPDYETYQNGVGAAFQYDPQHGDFATAIAQANRDMNTYYATMTTGQRDGIMQDIGWMLAAKQMGGCPPEQIPAP